MPELGTIAVFAAAAIGLLVVPGPSVFYLVTQSVSNGRSGGLAAMLGIQTAGLVHVLAAAAGLSAILMSSATAFAIVKYAGAAYLVWLGVQRLAARESIGDLPTAGGVGRSHAALYGQGFVVNLLNPKAALFFVAVMPTFIDRTLGRPWLQVLTLGGIFLAIAVVSDSAWVLASGWVARRLRSARARRAERATSSAILIALGVAAALQRRT